jgi:hypothetical protein
MKLGLLLEIIGFLLATVFAAIILERKFLGEFATKFEQFFYDSSKELNKLFPSPPKSSMYQMICYFFQALFIIGSCFLWYYIDDGFHSIFYVLLLISLLIFLIVPSYIRYKLWQKTYNEKLSLGNKIDWFFGFLHKDVIIIVLSIPGLLFTWSIVLLRFIFNWLAQPDKLKKMLIIVGTIIILTGLIIEFIVI